MAEEIRGLSVKFDADFSEFRKGMKEADKDIGSTQKRLKSLQDSLKLKWDNKKFVQAQQQTQKALEATEQKADLLRKRLSEMEKAGVTDETRDEYNYLEEQLAKTELAGQRLEEQLEQLDKIKLNNLTSGLDKATNKLNKAAAATKGISVISGATLVGLTATGLSAVNTADEIATLGTKYNMTAEAIQRFNYVALQTDTEAEDLYKAFTKVQAGVADLGSGVTTVATKALDQLELSFDQFSGTEEQFYAIVDSLSKMEDQTKMVSLVNDIFGERMGVNVLPLIYAGTDAINEYREEIDQLGILTEEQVQELAEFDNELNKVKTQFNNVKLELGSALLPVMQEFTAVLKQDIVPAIRSVIDWFSGLDEKTQSNIIKFLMFLAVMSPLLKMFSNVTKGISSLIKWFAKLDLATFSLYAKWALLLAAVGNLFNLLSNWSNMNPVQKIIGLLGALSAVALAAAVAFGAFHSAWSLGLAIGGIIAGIAATTAAVNAAGRDIGIDAEIPEPDIFSGDSGYTAPDYSIPKDTSSSSSVTNNNSNYVDNSNIVINIEKNEYMSEDDIIDAVNKGLRRAKQART